MEHIRGADIALIPQDSLSSLNPLYTIGNQLLEVIKKHQKDVIQHKTIFVRMRRILLRI